MNNKKAIITSTFVVLLLLAVVGIAYAFFSYDNGTRSEIVTGQIYMNYTEENAITLQNAWPETKKQALARPDNVFRFTIEGQNTSKEDIYYAIKINYADDIEGKTRIPAKHIKIYLECDGEVIVDGVNYYAWNDQKVAVASIFAGTKERITKNYTLRMWIDENVSISDTDSYADYTTAEWNNIYANLIVNVYGEAGESNFAGVSILSNKINSQYTNKLKTADNGNRYLSGTADEITNNYVLYSGELWRVVGINEDGTIKIIKDNPVTSDKWFSSESVGSGEVGSGEVSSGEVSITFTGDYSTSAVREWLNDSFLSTLDQNLIVDSTWDYSDLSYNTSTPSLTISEDKALTDKVGLLSLFDYWNVVGYDYSMISEVGLDGAYTSNNYLIKSSWDSWWLTNSIFVDDVYYATNVTSNGRWGYSRHDRYLYVRPVVNLKADVHIVNGDGSYDNPYELSTNLSWGVTETENISSITNLSDKIELTMNLTEEDVDGTRYLYGNVDNNYVWYSGKLWRIVAINGGDSVKLVTQSAMTTIMWDISSTNTDYSTSQIPTWLNEEFLPTLENAENLLKNFNWDYTTYTSATGTKIEPISTTKNEKVGLLTIYDYYKVRNNSNSNFLNNGYTWWTMSPKTDSSYVWYIDYYGAAQSEKPTEGFGVRPSINLKANVEIAGGEGTISKPYFIEGDKETGITSELLTNRISGEYINFNNVLYRIVGIEEVAGQKLTKVTMADYNVNGNTLIMFHKFGNIPSEAVYSPTYGIGLYLEEWYQADSTSETYADTYINDTYKAMIATKDEGVIWYIGQTTGGRNGDYTFSKKGPEVSATIGLGYYGEMFSSQFGDGYKSSANEWLMTRYANSSVWEITSSSSLNHEIIEYNPMTSYVPTSGVRPSFYLKPDVKIVGGSGMSHDPYEITME